MRNFGKMVKMMVAAVMMSAFFCSCNAAGGPSYEASEVSHSSSYETNNQNGPSTGSGISIKFKQMSITAETDGNRDKISSGESLQIRCYADEDSEQIGMCDWYIGGTKVASGTTYTFCQNNPGLYNVTCIAADSSSNPTCIDCQQLMIEVW